MLDEGFQRWVLEPEAHTDPFWPNWVLLHPEQEAEVLQARKALRALRLVGVRKELGTSRQQSDQALEPAPADQGELWDRIAREIAAEEKRQPAPAGRQLWLHTSARVAAAVLLLLVLGWTMWLRPHLAGDELVTYQTTYGQTRQVLLPDGSEIVLNANSRVTFPPVWPAGQDRQVSLSGEAFFAVKPGRKPRKFKVQLSGAQVEVLGTEFTVTDRSRLTRVVLNEGKIQVRLAGEGQAGKGHTAAVMVPGDLVEITRGGKGLVKSRVAKPENYSAFVQHVIEFRDSPLGEVARVLQDNYGYKVTFSPVHLAAKRFTSSNPDNRVDLLLFAIEKSFNLQVTRKGKHIMIREHGS